MRPHCPAMFIAPCIILLPPQSEYTHTFIIFFFYFSSVAGD